MSRDWRLYWDDILVACRKILRFTAGLDKTGFQGDERTYDAVLRNLEVIGEAVKNLPEDARNRAPAIELRRSPDCGTSSRMGTLASTTRSSGTS